MTHPDDGALLRHLDMELTECESEAVKGHLSRCFACNKRLAEIRSTMNFVANALSRTDLSSCSRRQISLPRKLAVAASILLAVTVYFTPLRAWVVERAQQIWNVGRDADGQIAPIQQPVVATQPAAGSVSFFPNGELFVLELTSRQQAGALTVSIGDGEMATATISGELIDESLLVLPDRLRIVNSRASTTTYTVVLPPGMRRIEVVVANENAVLLEPTEARRVWTIPVVVR